MSRPPTQPTWIGAGPAALFGVIHEATAARAGVLILAPFLHEAQRSHRLFALLGDALANCGCTVLRFDYYGTGDSAGADTDFSIDGAIEDALRAHALLRAQVAAPCLLLGVRAGAWIAQAVARATADRLALWQPLRDGASYLVELRRCERERLYVRRRFPLRSGPIGAPPETLMGHRAPASLPARIERATLEISPVLLMDEAVDPTSGVPEPDLVLPPALTHWVREVDISGAFPLPMVREVAARIAAIAGAR